MSKDVATLREPRTKAGLFLRNGLEALGFAEADANDAILAIEAEASEVSERYVDAVIATTVAEMLQPTETEALQEFAARYGIPLPEGLHIDSNLVGPKRKRAVQ